MKTKLLLGILLAAGTLLTPGGGVATAQQRRPDSEVLLRSYLHFALAREIKAQADAVAAELPDDNAAQVKIVAEEWFAFETENLRRKLDANFGEKARERFAEFVGDYTTAEEAGDQDFLKKLSNRTGLLETPTDYAALRRLALERWLDRPLSSGTRLLTEIQTWADLQGRKGEAVPPLDDWLARQQPEPAKPEPARPVNPLAAAEARMPEWDESRQRESVSALDSFSRHRQEKREKALRQAQAGMQQMALERQAAERERGDREMAKAQADAEAMRARAQRLAAAENEAMAQRENSWEARLKRIVGSTASAALGSFTGTVGTQAGREIANSIFN